MGHGPRTLALRASQGRVYRESQLDERSCHGHWEEKRWSRQERETYEKKMTVLSRDGLKVSSLEAVAELRDPSETVPARWPGQAAPAYQLCPTKPVVRRSETDRRRDGYKAQWRECLTKQSTFRFTPIPRHHLTFLSKLSDPLLHPCGMATPSGQRSDGWASPPHFHKHAACRSPRGLELKYTKKKSRMEWVVPEKEEAQFQTMSVQFCRGVPCYSKAVPNRQSWQPAPLLAYDVDNHKGGQPNVSLRSAASVTLHSGKYWLELQRLHRSIQRTLDQIRDPSRRLPAAWRHEQQSIAQALAVATHHSAETEEQCGRGH